MAHEQNQLPLNIPRSRVVLEDDDELLPIRVKWPWGDRPGQVPFEEARAYLQSKRGEGFPTDEPDIYTSWSMDKPPLHGFWNVTDVKTGTLNSRWWWDGIWCKGDPREKGPSRLTHEQFMTQYAWRGLKSIPSEAYECPPYNAALIAAAIPGCAITGKYVLRTRVPLKV